MPDRYQQFVESPAGRMVVKRLGLPQPTPLRRHRRGAPLLEGPALLGGSGRLRKAAATVLQGAGAEVLDAVPPDEDARFGAIVFDASGIGRSEDLRELYDFFHQVVRRLDASGRLIVLGTPPETSDSPSQAVAQRALEGFTRSAGKEIGRGATAQLVYVAPEAEGNMESTLRFLASGRSAYVSGQVIRIGAAPPVVPDDWERPLGGRVAVVTGASRGIGESIAEVLSRDGAHVVCVDVPAQGEALAAVANRVGGSTLQLDVTAPDAGSRLAGHLRERHGGVDVVVHNAGITRDKTLGRMSEDQWDSVLAVNLISNERINDVLLEQDVIKPVGRIVCVSSLSGIAGNRGQVNYATSKAGVIGIVQAYAPIMAERASTINAVAPGFIETQMTAAMPMATREAGRRMNSLSQGGLPVDVAEAIAWFASPGSAGVNGQVLSVSGQSLIGA